ncbi:semaphorin-2A-like [Tubulanus polymorphus]|uniref:semaphorin-2A-like n=1 Tax=Tubulanus polymorphus TaxID=672921 RepID=UPI003DA49731
MLTSYAILGPCRISWSCVLLVQFVVIFNLWTFGEPATYPIVIPRDALRPRSFVNEQLKSKFGYYRYLTVDEESQTLYVGAQNYVYRLDLSDISKQPLSSEEIKPSVASTCKTDKLECQNHIRFIVQEKDLLFICGTGGQSPIAFTLNQNNLTHSTVPNKLTTKCPYDPNHNSTMLWVEKGNPKNIPMYYYGFPQQSVNDMDPVISRIEDVLRTKNQRQSRMGLNAPVDFVGSYEWGDYVYFWYREVAVELGDGHSKSYARVARVCKNDSQIPATYYLNFFVWFTYVKARLKCTIPNYKPNAFDHLQDVFLINDTFYATFATNSGLNGGLDASAICEYDVENINNILDNSNLLKLNDMKIEPLPVGPDLVNLHRIKRCGRTDADAKNNTLLTMTHDYLLTEKSVEPNDNLDAVYYTTSSVYRKIAVHIVNGKTVYYLATDHGNIYKLVTWTEKNPTRVRHHLLAKWQLFNKRTLIWSFKLHGDSLYIGTDEKVLQLGVNQCSNVHYQSCHLCIRDPYCGWNNSTKTCQKFTPGLLQNILEPSVCKCTIQDVHVTMPGNAANLPCNGRQTTSSPVTWFRNEVAIKPSSDYLFTKDDGLIILNVTLDMRNNTFTCQSSENDIKFNLVRYKIIMTECEGSGDDFLRCEFIESYKKWKMHFKLVQQVQKKWQCIANKYPSCTDAHKPALPCGMKHISPEISNEIPNNR